MINTDKSSYVSEIDISMQRDAKKFNHNSAGISTVVSSTVLADRSSCESKNKSDVEQSKTVITHDLLHLARSLEEVSCKGVWESLGSEVEVNEENGSQIQRREPISVKFDVPREVLLRHRGSHASGFLSKDASEDSRDLRPVNNLLYTIAWSEVDDGVQATMCKVSCGAQTHHTRTANASVQAEPTLTDACILHITPPKKESLSMMTFLNRVIPRVNHCLTQNFEIPIYSDDYAMFKEDEAITGGRDEMILLEKGNYTHAAVKDRRITSISWRSAHTRDDVVAVAAITPNTLAERVENQRRCESSVSLVWSFADPMHPRYILESPNEVQVLRFSPSRPHLVAGGAMNGQVYLWDLSLADKLTLFKNTAVDRSRANEQHKKNQFECEKNNNEAATHANMSEKTNTSANVNAITAAATSTTISATQTKLINDANAKLPDNSKKTENTLADNDTLKLAQVDKINADDEINNNINNNVNVDSSVDAMSSAKEVGEVISMPDNIPGVTVEMDGDVMVPRLQPLQSSRVELSHRRPVHDLCWLPDNLECTLDGKQTVLESSHQFATVSDDGSVCVWDIRSDYLPTDKQRKLKHQSKSNGQEVLWVPLHRYTMNRPDGSSREVMGFRLQFNGLMTDDSPAYSAAVGSSDGEIAYCSMVARHDRRESVVIPTFGQTKETQFVRSIVSAHAGPVYSIERHPIIGDVYLSCGDHCFKVWRHNLTLPLYHSPKLESAITCATWSPTRPAIVFVGTSDGKLAVWDLLDRNNEPLLTHHMVQDAITTLQFKSLPPRVRGGFRQQLAIGTNLGSFHWYTLPGVLSRTPNGEKRYFRAMLEREARRAAYYSWRQEVRQQEIDRFGVNVPKIVLGGTAASKVSSAKQSNKSAVHKSKKRHATDSRASKNGTNYGHADWHEREEEDDDSYANEDDDDNEDEDDFSNFYAHNPQRDAEFLAKVQAAQAIKEEHNT